MSAHTAGPWRVASSSNYPFSVDGRLNIDAEQRGYVCLAGDRDDAEAVANAHLIAAAPDLKDVADTAPNLSMYHGESGFDVERFIAHYSAWSERKRAAIAKAEGR